MSIHVFHRGHGHINYDEESTNWFAKADIPAVKLATGWEMCHASVQAVQMVQSHTTLRFVGTPWPSGAIGIWTPCNAKFWHATVETNIWLAKSAKSPIFRGRWRWHGRDLCFGRWCSVWGPVWRRKATVAVMKGGCEGDVRAMWGRCKCALGRAQASSNHQNMPCGFSGHGVKMPSPSEPFSLAKAKQSTRHHDTETNMVIGPGYCGPAPH